MKKLLYFFSSLVMGAVMFTGCYKDKSNTLFTNTNVITTKNTINTNDTFNVLLPDTLKINVTVNQTIPNAAGVTFQWVLFSGATPGRIVGTSQNLKTTLTENPGQYTCILYAKDNNTNQEFQHRFIVNVQTAYNQGWVIVEENAGNCDLSMIVTPSVSSTTSPIPQPQVPAGTILRNCYSSNNDGKFLPAGTFQIPRINTAQGVSSVVTPEVAQSVFAFFPGGLQQLNYGTFRKVFTQNQNVFGGPVPTPFTPQCFFQQRSSYQMLISNGAPFGKIFC